MIIPDRWFVEPIQVQTYQGGGAYGETYADAVTVLGHIAGGQTVHWATQGNDVVPSQRILLPNPCRLADGTGTVNPADLLTPQSRVISDTITSDVGAVEHHIQPGSGALIYVSGQLG